MARLAIVALACGVLAGHAAAARQRLDRRSSNATMLRVTSTGTAASSAACRALRVAATAAKAGADPGKHVCPESLPTKEGQDQQKPFFTKLHNALIKGNGHLEGCMDGSSREYYVETFEQELECLYTLILKDGCGALPSQHEKRQEQWELKCLDGTEDLLAAYDLMTEGEKMYFHKFKKSASERQIYKTYIELAGYKELACIFMKTVDDECVAFSKPRMLPPAYWDKDWKL
mmetsp:Transcript_37713/g.74867  ORF Transcript_37713/g.74867 Transcript_37713/m.74867 type:complete len:231 (+) Transcript_37713:45-737(+)